MPALISVVAPSDLIEIAFSSSVSVSNLMLVGSIVIFDPPQVRVIFAVASMSMVLPDLILISFLTSSESPSLISTLRPPSILIVSLRLTYSLRSWPILIS